MSIARRILLSLVLFATTALLGACLLGLWWVAQSRYALMPLLAAEGIHFLDPKDYTPAIDAWRQRTAATPAACSNC
mgnify:CR=1 FL=1